MAAVRNSVLASASAFRSARVSFVDSKTSACSTLHCTRAHSVAAAAAEEEEDEEEDDDDDDDEEEEEEGGGKKDPKPGVPPSICVGVCLK